MDPARDEIIEIGLVVFSREETLETYSTLIQPRSAPSLDILTLTGIEPQELAAAPHLGDVAREIRQKLAGRPIVGQSVQMDLAMLDAAGLILPNPMYDTYDLATLLVPDLGVYSLEMIAKRLGVPAQQGHRALDDALAAAAVFRALLDRLDEYDAPTLSELTGYARAAGLDAAELFAQAAEQEYAGPLFASDEPAKRGAHELAFLTPRERPEPLRPTGAERGIDERQITSDLAPGGALSRVVPGYEHRPQQEAMARAVATAFNRGGELMVEAGTGTGKSIAYLLPSIRHATAHGEPVVVSTNTLALQDQLYQKDIPDLREALKQDGAPVEFDAAVLKGRTNYLCLRRWFAMQRQPVHDPAEARLRARVLLWLGQTATGDRAELRLTPEEEGLWRQLSAEEDACLASRCVFQQRNQCFLFRARRAAEHAHLVIVNHALLLSDMVAGSRILPDYEHLVIDEAHHLEDQATQQLGYSVDERALNECVDDMIRQDGPVTDGAFPSATTFLNRFARDDRGRRRASAATDRARQSTPLVATVRTVANDLFARLNEFIRRHESGRGFGERSLRLIDAVRHDGAWIEIEIIWERIDQALQELEGQARWFADAVESVEPEDDDEAGVAQRDELEADLSLAARTAADLRWKLRAVISNPEPDQVYWLERSPILERVSAKAAPLHVGDLLRDQLFHDMTTTVLTSATITTDGTFDYIEDRIGLEDADELMVPSPFDYERSTLLYVTDDIPEPSSPGYQRGVERTLIETCEATQGRALVLFTSHAALQATYKAIKQPLADRGIIVLGQRIDGNPRQLIDRLRQTPRLIVLGTASFWEGVDVVGPALSLLVVTKLPFAVPSDPIFAARSEHFEQPFLQYAVPQAVLKFKQGFGRLIRSGKDRGVCAVLDRRVISKRYGASFVQSLPECSVQVGSGRDLPEAAVEWLQAR